MPNYQKILFSLIENRQIKNFPITKEVCEDTQLLEYLLKYDNENCYKLHHLNIFQEHAPQFFLKLILDKNKSQYELEKILPQLTISEDLAKKLLDVNDQYISYFPQFHNKEFLLRRLQESKSIGLNRLHNLSGDHDIAQAIIENNNKKDFRWLDKELYVQYMDTIIRKKDLVCDFLDAFELYDPLPYEPNKDFYEIVLHTNLYALRYIHRDLPQDIDYIELLFNSWLEEEKVIPEHQEKITEWQRDILLLLRELPSFAWRDNQAIEKWLPIFSEKSKKTFYDLSFDRLMDKMSEGNELFNQFSQTEYSQNLRDLHNRYYANNLDFAVLDSIFKELEQLDTQWHNFKLHQQLTIGIQRNHRNKI